MTHYLLYHATSLKTGWPSVDWSPEGLHFGSLAQAQMRRPPGGRILQAEIFLQKPQRRQDTGGYWSTAVRNARRQGHHGIVYLNRVEGIPLERFTALRAQGIYPDQIADAAFRRLVPEATDSFIVLREEAISWSTFQEVADVAA